MVGRYDPQITHPEDQERLDDVLAGRLDGLRSPHPRLLNGQHLPCPASDRVGCPTGARWFEVPPDPGSTMTLTSTVGDGAPVPATVEVFPGTSIETPASEWAGPRVVLDVTGGPQRADLDGGAARLPRADHSATGPARR